MGEYITKPVCKIIMLKGQEGQSIKKIIKTSTSGLVDTYTITLTDGTTSTFTVTNGKAISGISKTGTSGLVDTYTIRFNDGTTSTFSVTNGKAISGISKTGTSGLVDTYTIRFNDGTTSTFTVANGAKGDKGDGIPTGGTTGQVLKKKSNTDYEYEWADITPISSILNDDIDSIVKE
nr:MAG: hypothetical protein [Bacteriophage sp.]